MSEDQPHDTLSPHRVRVFIPRGFRWEDRTYTDQELEAFAEWFEDKLSSLLGSDSDILVYCSDVPDVRVYCESVTSWAPVRRNDILGLFAVLFPIWDRGGI